MCKMMSSYMPIDDNDVMMMCDELSDIKVVNEGRPVYAHADRPVYVDRPLYAD